MKAAMSRLAVALASLLIAAAPAYKAPATATPVVPNPTAAIDALIFGTRLTGSVTFRFDTTGVSGKFDNFGNDIGLTQFVSGGFFWSGPIVHVTLANRKPLRDSQTPAIHPPR